MHYHNCQMERQRKLGVGCVGLPQRRTEKAALLIRFSRDQGPRKSPAKRVLWGEDEQGSEHDFRRQAEMEWSGLCEDEGVLRGYGPYGARPLSGRSFIRAAPPKRAFAYFSHGRKVGPRRAGRPY